MRFVGGASRVLFVSLMARENLGVIQLARTTPWDNANKLASGQTVHEWFNPKQIISKAAYSLVSSSRISPRMVWFLHILYCLRVPCLVNLGHNLGNAIPDKLRSCVSIWTFQVIQRHGAISKVNILKHGWISTLIMILISWCSYVTVTILSSALRLCDSMCMCIREGRKEKERYMVKESISLAECKLRLT